MIATSCGSSSSTPRLTRPLTTTPWPLRWRARAPMSSSSPAASCTGRSRAQRATRSTSSSTAGPRAAGSRPRDELGVPPERVHVIPHGAFDYLTRTPEERPLPDDLASVEGPVVLFFGLLRPYKGVDVLIEAFREVQGAELWVVGMPRMPIERLRELARQARSPVRFVDRFVTDPEIPADFRPADPGVLP